MVRHLCVCAGLCGNFNEVLFDDLKTPQGVVEGTAVSFANAWKALSNCPDRSERMDDPCSYSSDSGERLFTSKVSMVIVFGGTSCAGSALFWKEGQGAAANLHLKAHVRIQHVLLPLKNGLIHGVYFELS